MKKITVIILIYLVSVQFGLAFAQNNHPEQTALAYLSLWQSGDYSAMYDMLSEQSKNYVSRTEFIAWHQEFRDKYIIERFEIMAVENQGQRARVEYRLDLTEIGGGPKMKNGLIRLAIYTGHWEIDY